MLTVTFLQNFLDQFPTVRKHLVPMNGSGCMHSKLQLLKYEDYLRVVVPSANLVSFDWGETGDMENVSQVYDQLIFLVASQLTKGPILLRFYSSSIFLYLITRTSQGSSPLSARSYRTSSKRSAWMMVLSEA